jgi:hypothetical protein
MKKLLPLRVPWRIKTAFEAFMALEFRYGRFRSAGAGRSIDRDGKPIPWYSYPAIEYLSQLDFTERTVFEFGSGNSTLFWAARARQVVTLEHDAAWFRQMGAMPANVEYILCEDRSRYPSYLREGERRFDVIVIDGIDRRACAEGAAEKLQPGGLVILDNADWHPETAAYLRARGFLEVDMHGFAPVVSHTATTSLFFSRDFAVPPLEGRQPHYSVCALRWNHETP